MSGLIWGLVLAAALMHAGWNAFVKIGADRVMALSLVMGMGTLISLPVALTLPFPDRAAWGFMAVSSMIHFFYKLSLAAAYRAGDFSHVYPIARGAAPLLSALLVWALIHERPEGMAVWGIAAILAGLTALALRGGPRLAQDPRPVMFALLTACCIACYTALDGIGARRSGDALGYAFWLMVGDGIPITIYAIATRGRAAMIELVRRDWLKGMLGGATAVVAYAIVLWAMTRAPIGVVAALRETSVIFAMLIGAAMMKERLGPWRIGAALLTLAGVMMLKL